MSLEKLKEHTLVVSDTGEFNLIEKYRPQDATTNPSLIYSASRKSDFSNLIDSALSYAKEKGSNLDEQVELALDRVAVNFGLEILKLIPGRVSTEIDARLSFDTDATVKKAKQIIELYESEGVNRDRILVKIASTWEGLAAGRLLEKEGIHVNMTLMFSLAQAQVAAEAGATLISPFVGRIFDWYKAKDGVSSYPPQEDPGVKSVTQIYNYYKTHGYNTIVMGASFRNKEQVLALAGCDALTVSPNLLEEIQSMDEEVPRKLCPENKSDLEKRILSEAEFRYEMCMNEMAGFKLDEGIRKFVDDLVKLEKEFRDKLSA